MTIGERAMEAVREQATVIKAELRRLNIPQDTFYKWTKSAPSAYCLQQFALGGYDVHYILTGERKIYDETRG